MYFRRYLINQLANHIQRHLNGEYPYYARQTYANVDRSRSESRMFSSSKNAWKYNITYGLKT